MAVKENSSHFLEAMAVNLQGKSPFSWVLSLTVKENVSISLGVTSDRLEKSPIPWGLCNYLGGCWPRKCLLVFKHDILYP